MNIGTDFDYNNHIMHFLDTLGSARLLVSTTLNVQTKVNLVTRE